MKYGGGWVVATATGYIPVPGIPVDDYRDFLGRQFTSRDLRLDLAHGVLPPGLILADDTGTIAVVCGRYEHPQTLTRINVEQIMEVTQ